MKGWDGKMSECKQCFCENNNGTNFCSRKCRMDWIKQHEIKGAKKRAVKQQEEYEMSFGSDFSNENDCQDSY